MKKKGFDAVEMMHRGAEALREKLDGMSPEEQRAFWDETTREMSVRIRQAKADAKQRSESTSRNG